MEATQIDLEDTRQNLADLNLKIEYNAYTIKARCLVGCFLSPKGDNLLTKCAIGCRDKYDFCRSEMLKHLEKIQGVNQLNLHECQAKYFECLNTESLNRDQGTCKTVLNDCVASSVAMLREKSDTFFEEYESLIGKTFEPFR